MPKVSVIIPVYNGARYLREAIESVLTQSYRDVEVIIVDDGSTDNTAAVVADIHDTRLKYIYHENRGVAAARNTGVQASRGEYIALQDDDNVLFPDAVGRHVDFMDRNPGVGFTHGQFVTMDESGIPLRKKPRGPASTFIRNGREEIRHLVLGDRTIGLFFLIRRSCLDDVGLFKIGLLMSEDWDIWIRLAKYYDVGHVSGPIAKVRVHHDSMTACSKVDVIQESHRSVLESVFSDAELGPLYRPLRNKADFGLYCLCAREAAFTGHKWLGVQYVAKAISASPVMLFEKTGISVLMRSGKDFLPQNTRRLIINTLMSLRLR
jgi:glycosyltransferase involved in cell wall biosynthesis